MRMAAGAVAALALLNAGSVSAGQSLEPVESSFLGGVAAPAAPAVIARDTDGHATIRAVRVQEPLKIDGVLDESVYSTVPPFGDFIQADPIAGVPATENTEGWVFFDDQNLYVVLRCWDSQPQRIVASEMRRDNTAISQNDHVGFTLDTFYDHRNGVSFTVNTLGGRMDGQVTDERQWNGDVNPIWTPKIGWFEGGWTMESAVPFKSLRYSPSRSQVWGIVIRRENRGKNEVSYLTAMPRAKAVTGLMILSSAATLVGLEAPQGSRRLEIKPYAIASTTTDAVTGASNDGDGDIGVDLKYGITQNVTADFTYNTDFAQVEADEQQVNLTRFNLFFPEKREFFLENQGTFAFGGAGSTGTSNSADLPVLFYSRRIGLEGTGSVPIQAGGRVTGRIGRFNIGGLDIQAEGNPGRELKATNFSVVRVKRDILRRSSVGMLYTGRSTAQRAPGRNQVFGMDTAFSFYANLNVNAYWAKSETTGLSGDDTSYRGQLDYAGDRYGLQLERLSVGDSFNPEVGFIRRAGIRQTFGQFRFSPRPAASRRVRKYTYRAALQVTETVNRLDTRLADAEFATEFHNGDRLSVIPSASYEYLPAPFRIAPEVVLPVGAYDWTNLRLAYSLSQQRDLAGSFSVDHGTFYDGHRTVVGVSQGRLKISPQFSIQPTASLNWIDLPQGSFTTRLIGSRVTYTMTPLMFVSALIQYNSSNRTLSSNVRLRWEYAPGSELFVVYNDQRDTLGTTPAALLNRSVVVKVNRLFRF